MENKDQNTSDSFTSFDVHELVDKCLKELQEECLKAKAQEDELYTMAFIRCLNFFTTIGKCFILRRN